MTVPSWALTGRNGPVRYNWYQIRPELVYAQLAQLRLCARTWPTWITSMDRPGEVIGVKYTHKQYANVLHSLNS